MIEIIERTIQIVQIKVKCQQICGKFNPQWKAGDNNINEDNENVASYLCYRGAWEAYLDSSVASYAIGSPSAEMYIDAWNQFKGSKVLDYNWVASGATLQYGSASVNGYAYAPGYGKTSITDFGIYTPYNTLTTEANSMFMTGGSCWLWLASPSCFATNRVCFVAGGNAYLSGNLNDAYGVCPLVSLGS